MKTESTVRKQPDETMSEVWQIKEENAAAHAFDMDAIAAAARKNQEKHSDRVVSKHAGNPKPPDESIRMPAP